MTSSALASEERYQFEHYKDDIGAPVVQASIASIVIVLLFVPVRLYAQSTLTRWWALVDTWLIFAAAALSLTTSGLSIAMVRYGLGRHTLRVIMDDKDAPYNAVMVARLGYILFVLSAPELACIKLAILTFYSRIFKIRESRNAFFWSVWAIGIFSLALGIATTVEYITACLPPAWYWTRIYVALQIYDFDGPKSGTCEAPLPHSVIPLSLDLASEIAIIILPMPYLWKLNLPRGKKASLIVAFGIGAFVTAISVVRIVAAAKIRSINDFTFDDTAATMWNPIQQSLAVACACIPACAPLYRSVSNKMSTFSASISSRVPRMGSLSTGTTATRVSSTRMPKDSGRHPWDRIGVIEDVDDDEIAVFHKRSDGSFRTSPRNVEAGYNLRTYPPSTAVRHDSLSVSDIG